MKMNVPFYTSTREYLARKQEFDLAVQGVMSRGDFILGSEVTRFEEECANYLGAKFAVGVASGSDGLVIAADILGFGNGAEVLTPTFTFFASTSCVARLGGKPVLIDMDEETLNLDLTQAAQKITKATKGIIPVHLFIQPTPMQPVIDLARENNLKVLEDAAEAWGMECLVDGGWRKAGTIGDIGTYSFFPTKTMGAYGDAGLATTNDPELYDKLRSYRVHGSSQKYQHDYIGYNSRLDSMQAAILRVKMQRTEDAIARRLAHGNHYRSLLSPIQGIRLPNIQQGNRGVYYVFNILVPHRDELACWLKEHGVGTSIYYPRPLHLQKCFAYLGYKEGDFPVAERISKEILALPMYPELTAEEIDYICNKIHLFFKTKQ